MFRCKRILKLIQIFFCGLEKIFVTRVSPANPAYAVSPLDQRWLSKILEVLSGVLGYLGS